MRGFIGNGARILVQRAIPADADEGLVLSLEQDFKKYYGDTWPGGTVPYEGITTLLESLQNRGYPLAVLSNKPHPFTVAMVSQVFPGIRFTAVLGQRPGIHHKPDPTGALEISDAFGLIPGECTLIGDSTLDIETARNAGMKSVAVMWGFNDRERLLGANPDRIAENPEEISKAFP